MAKCFTFIVKGFLINFFGYLKFSFDVSHDLETIFPCKRSLFIFIFTDIYLSKKRSLLFINRNLFSENSS